MNNTADIFFAIISNLIAIFDANLLNNIPIITGTVTIKNMLIAILIKEMSLNKLSAFNKFKEVTIINGIVITLNKLIIAVREIDSATSPLANEVNILDVTPPGAEAMIITPIASSGETDQSLIRINATIGSKII